VDGEAGDKTIAAVKSFQKLVKLTQDGLFGKDCLAKAKTYKK
jgi:peptidoglycan hydrolase-like protein with peptidoglycan-binding domain